MERVLTLDHRHHGKGTVLYSWHPSGQFLATVGTITSLINGPHSSVGGHVSAPTANPAHAQTRCIWIWAMNGAGAKTKEAREKAQAAAATAGLFTPPVPVTPATSTPSTTATTIAAASSSAPLSTAGGKTSSPAPSSLGGASPPGPACTHGGAEKLFQIFPPNPAPCIGLEWDSTGTTLAILQAAPAHEVLLWNFSTQETEHVDLSIREPTFMRWSKTSNQLAIGTGRGELLLYDRAHRTCWYANARHKKRITCGDWNSENKFAFASDDRQITICSADGKTQGQVKVKSRPTNVKFGGNEQDRENIVSVSMDRKTILLYNLDDPENALELAFQARYGSIVSFKWFKDGYVMVGFSLGYLVVISTHLEEVGREQFCARFHKDALRDIAYCPSRHKVATAGEHQLKIVDMADWQELYSEDVADARGHATGPLDKLAWTTDGSYVSVSSRNGCLYVYSVASSAAGGAGDSAAARAARARELEDAQATHNKLLYRPLSPACFFAASAVVLVTTVASIAHSVGLPLLDMWKLAAFTWSV